MNVDLVESKQKADWTKTWLKARQEADKCLFFCFCAEGDLYFTTKLQNYTAVEKDEVKLVCELSKAIADVKWFKEGKEITPSKNIAISTDGKKRILMVRKAEKANIGEYSCDCGSDKTTAKLNIEGETRQLRPQSQNLSKPERGSVSVHFILHSWK